MYSKVPTLERRILKLTLVVAWAFLAFSGFGGMYFPGSSVVAAVGPEWLSVVTSGITMVASVVAMFGVILSERFWWLEWVGAGFAGFGLVYYVAVPWWYLLSGDLGRMQQSGVVATCLIGFTLFRAVSGWVHSRKLARRHLVITAPVPHVE